MASQEKGKAPTVGEGENADIRPKYYRDALAFLARLKDPLGPNFEEFCRQFCEFMHKRQTFYDKASLLLKEHPGLLTGMPKALDSIVGWDQNLRESFLADLTRICSASAPSSSAQSAITVADNKLQQPKTRPAPVATQANVSSGNEHLNREVQEIKLLNTGEYWSQQLQQQMQKRAQKCVPQSGRQYLQQYAQKQAEREEEPSTSLCLLMNSDIPAVSVPDNVLRGNDHLSREIQDQELPRQEPIPTSSVLVPQRVSKGNVHLSQEVQVRELAQQYVRQQMQQQLLEYWQPMQQYASQEQESPRGREHQRLQQLHMQQYQNQWQQQLGNEHLSIEILKQELARQEPNTSSVPVAMQQNVSRGNEHLSQEVWEQELLIGRESWQQQQSGNAPQKPYARPQRYEQQPHNVPQKPYARPAQYESKEGYAQQQQQGRRLQQYYVQLQQQYAQQRQQFYVQLHTQQESDMQYRQRVVQHMYEQQQQQQRESYRQYRLQQQYAQQQANTPQQSYVQPHEMQQSYMQPQLNGQQQDSQHTQQSLQPGQQTGQQQAKEQNAGRNTSPRTKRD